jgi:cell fate (sporulation/competence/biofilm development) regulator YlbF (YheA/YmcA/DUF963 family)
MSAATNSIGDLEKELDQYLKTLETTMKNLEAKKEVVDQATLDANSKSLISTFEKMNTIIKNLDFGSKSEAMLNEEIRQLEADNLVSTAQYNNVKGFAGMRDST